MNYTYTLRRVDPKLKLLGVIYHVEGRDDFFKNFNIDDFSQANVQRVIEESASVVLDYWEEYDAAPDTSEVELGGTGTGKAYKTIREDEPVYDPAVERLEEVITVDEAADTKTISWTVVPLPEAEAIPNLLERVAAHRYAKESEGLHWTDAATGQVFYLDTTAASQSRFSSARLMVEAGERINGAVWKCADVTSGSPVITFRPTTNAELVEWSRLVHTHVQKCFDAEATATRRILRGDLSATFTDAFNEL